ncbi:MAG: hypothetical protein JW951_03130 [Lentisphaerae bacterium]|nr:hypothetical protein [Lentisphaerota bacterium]
MGRPAGLAGGNGNVTVSLYYGCRNFETNGDSPTSRRRIRDQQLEQCVHVDPRIFNHLSLYQSYPVSPLT